MKRYRSIFIGLVVAAAMITGICHDYLWGPDEPRVAEIARETLIDGHWVTPHLCGLPFLEKPPLYFDLIALAILLCATLIGHSPVLFYLVHNRRSKSCLELAPDVWKIVGRSSLYLYRPDDDIRGSIPFYGKRPTPEINRPEELKKILNSREKVYVIIRPWIYEALLCDPAINRFLQSMEIQPITGPEALPCLVLVSNRTS